MQVLSQARDRNPHLPKSVPDKLFIGCERSAERFHSQTLARLNERGGLDPVEMLALWVGSADAWRMDTAVADFIVIAVVALASKEIVEFR